MKRSQAIALTALTTTLAAGLTLTLVLMNRRKQRKRKEFIANEGYEMAYDIHYPVKYRRPSRRAEDQEPSTN